MTPQDYGFTKFSSYRPLQLDALNRTRDAFTHARLVGISAPTGFGKSLAALTLAAEPAGRTAILVSSRALEDQYLDDAGSVFVNVRGRNNYQCLTYRDCDDGRHRRCGYQKPDMTGSIACPYVQALNRAQLSKYITNYRYFIEMQRRGSGLGDLDRIVCDEAHQLIDTLTQACAVTLTERDRQWLQVAHGEEDLAAWSAAAEDALPTVMSALEAARRDRHIADVKKFEELAFKFSTLAEAQPDDWATDWDKQGRVKFEPIDAGLFGEVITMGALEVVFMSATLRPVLFEFLGVDAADFEFIEMGSDFPPANAPIYVMPTVRVDWKMTPNDYNVLRVNIDNWIARRLDRKGVVHAVSYDRADWLKKNSKYGDLMITHGRGQARAGVEQFRRADAPAILVSPAVDTGFDFPGDVADWQVIMKLPRMSAEGSKNLIAARKKRFPRWSEYGVCQRLEQMAGRINRSKSDRAETVIFDAHAGEYFLAKNSDLFTSHFNKRLVYTQQMPKPIELAA